MCNLRLVRRVHALLAFADDMSVQEVARWGTSAIKPYAITAMPFC